MVTDSAICRAAVAAFRKAMLPDSAKTTEVHVIRSGLTRYIVVDEFRKAGECMTSVIFHATFTQVLNIESE